MILTFIVVVILLLWSITGVIRFANKDTDDDLPTDLKSIFCFYIVGGPISWLIGIGFFMYYSMDILNDKLEEWRNK